MDDRDQSRSPDALRLVVDGVEFSIEYDPSQPGAYHYTRRTRPASGYGFTSRSSDHQRSTIARHIDAIRDFLAMCDPDTGYLEDDPDDPDDDGSDDDQ